MTTILWLQLVGGLLILGVGLFPLRGFGRHLVLLGILSVAYSAATLLGSGQGYLTVLYAAALIGVVATFPRDSWRQARWEVLLGIGTMLGLLVLNFMYSWGFTNDADDSSCLGGRPGHSIRLCGPRGSVSGGIQTPAKQIVNVSPKDGTNGH